MNNLFAADEIEPCILVFTTYYMDPAGDSKERLKSGNVPAGDGNWDGLPANFWMEVTEDIMPLVESRYNTYAKNDVSPEGLMRLLYKKELIPSRNLLGGIKISLTKRLPCCRDQRLVLQAD